MTPPLLIPAIDSYFMYVLANMIHINPDRNVVGMANAQDWPVMNVVPNGLYLLYLTSDTGGGTTASPRYTHFCQWVWTVEGTDIQANTDDANRGDRYRTNITIQSELLRAHFPGFCEKKFYQADDNYAGTGFYPAQTISWNRLKFRPTTNNQAGVIYGVATFEITAMEDVQTLAPLLEPTVSMAATPITTQTLTSHNVSALMAVYVHAGEAYPATLAGNIPAVGIAINGSTSSTVTIQYEGVLNDLTWNWIPDEPVYVGENGTLTQVAPNIGFIQVVGTPVSSTSLLIEVQEATFIA